MKNKIQCFEKRPDSTRLANVGRMYAGCMEQLDSLKKYMKGSTLLAVVLAMNACSDDKDAYYDRPDWLEQPIYQELEMKGHFTHYLKLIDRTLYSTVLKGTGNYTVFAPNDEAFVAYLKDKGYQSVDDIPEEEAIRLVGYSLAYNKYTLLHLGDILSGGTWNVNRSMRKKTAVYDMCYQEEIKGVTQWVVNGNTSGGTFNVSANDYKFIPVLSQPYFSAQTLTALDYETFYPGKQILKANVNGASLLQTDIYAENGIIHEVNEVTEVLGNLGQLIEDEKFDEFNKLLNYEVTDNNYFFLRLLDDKNAYDKFRKIFPDKNISKMYVKSYTGLAFNPYFEGYRGSASTLSDEQEGYTMFIPSNEAILEFREKIEKYAPLSQLSTNVLTYFMNSHMVDALVWPSHYASSQNMNGEYLNGKGAAGESFAQSGIKGTMASNGFLYTTDNVIKSKYFETVFAELLLNPEYSLTNLGLTSTDPGTAIGADIAQLLLSCVMTGNPDENFSVLLPTDDMLREDGYRYNSYSLSFENPLLLNSANANTMSRLNRLVRMCIFRRVNNAEIDCSIRDFSGTQTAMAEYDGWSYAVNGFGDIARFKDNKLQTIGNILENTYVELTKVDSEYINGQFFKTGDVKPEYSERTTYPYVDRGWTDPTPLATIAAYVNQNPNTSLYYEYFKKVITELSRSTFYTFLMPTNEVIAKAIEDGELPKLEDVDPQKAEEWRLTLGFVRSHVMIGAALPDDGLARIIPGNYSTFKYTTLNKISYKGDKLDLVNENTYLSIVKEGGALKFVASDVEDGTSVIIRGIGNGTAIRGIQNSNYIGSRCVVHAVDGYVTFAVQE